MDLTQNAQRVLYDAQLCSRCKFCTTLCPTYDGWLGKAPVGRIQAVLYALRNKSANFHRLADMIYACTLCGGCEEICTKFMAGVKVKEIIRLARVEAVERASISPNIRDFLENLYKYGNPYGISRKKRSEWSNDLEIEHFKNHDLLYYVGCVGSYDPIGQDVTRSFCQLLLKLKISVGILGQEENCEGNEAYLLGEEGLFELLAEKNIKIFNRLGVKRIVTTDPHAYNALKNKYPEMEREFEVMHHTQLIWKLIKEGKLKLVGASETTVTYHDPCFLGRWNSIYEEPRKILESIPGVSVIEMGKNKENSFCCGGGSANFYTDLSSNGKNPAKTRIFEALETGATELVTACPTCAVMLRNAATDEGLNDDLVIKDIAQIVNEHLK